VPLSPCKLDYSRVEDVQHYLVEDLPIVATRYGRQSGALAQWAASENHRCNWGSKSVVCTVSRVLPLHTNSLFRLYLTNLSDKLQKPDLRLSLYTLFSTYGPVLDVVAMKTAKMRGQAHIVFRDVQASTQAMRALQGFDFFGKEMVSLSLLFR